MRAVRNLYLKSAPFLKTHTNIQGKIQAQAALADVYCKPKCHSFSGHWQKYVDINKIVSAVLSNKRKQQGRKQTGLSTDDTPSYGEAWVDLWSGMCCLVTVAINEL